MEEIETLLKGLYNLAGKLTPLEGYANENYKLTTNSRKFIVKLNDDISEFGLIAAQNNLLQYLSKNSESEYYPGPIKSKHGNSVELIENQGRKKLLRVFGWLEGSLIKDVTHTENLFEDLGRKLGRMDKSLFPFDEAYIKQRFSDWDLQHASFIAKNSFRIKDPANRRIAEYFFLQFEKIAPELTSLRKSIIHADANDFNLLVNNDTITGIIDFGDCVYSHTVNELAISLAYALMGKEDPVKWAEYIVEGYNSEFRLEEIEVEFLYYLIAARLAMSVTRSAVSKQKHPENKYLIVSEQPARKLLWKWLEINPIHFTMRMKRKCNLNVNAGYSTDQLISLRNDHISGSLSIGYKQPILMKKAALQYMYSDDGVTYLDCVNNICHVGHVHPRVVHAGQKQMAVLNTNTRYLYEILLEYSQKLTAKFPDPLDTVFFVNSGSEAGDLAQRIARTITSQKNTIVIDHAYHGNTIAGIEASPYKYEGKGGPGVAEHIHKLEIPDGYRGRFKYMDPDAGRKYAAGVDDVLKNISLKNQGLAAFYCESIIGCGGQVVLPEGYLDYIYKKVRKHGGLCIADEVQVGFGRVGEKFWGFELQGVVPDIVALGKPMGNGHPIAAVITTKKIADKFNNGMEFFSSFGGNPVSCAIGLEVLKVIEEENLQHHAKITGQYFKQSLELLSAKQNLIGDVRGHGLFLGVEMVEDKVSLTPATDKARWIVEEMKKRGILLSTDGPYDNVIKIKPPLVFNKNNVDRVISTLDEVMDIL